jgi:hypothetical protein
MPGQGVTSCFTFGRALGRILGVLEALDVRTVLIDPKTWHKAVLGTPALPADKAARRKEWKRLAIAQCLSRWPALNLKASPRCRVDHDGMADALCLALYGFDGASWLE